MKIKGKSCEKQWEIGTGARFSLKRYGGEVFAETVRGRGFHSNGTGTKFSLRRYGGDVFTQTVRGRNGTGARLSLKRYGGEVFAHTPRGRCFHSLGTGARLSLKRYGGEVCRETVRGRGFHSNGLGRKPSAIHEKLLGNAWGLFLGNSFVRRGPITGRTHPHACKIPYKTALPVLCPHRFILDPFLVTFSLLFFVSFF